MCKYGNRKSIVVTTKEQCSIINRLLLESKENNSTPTVSTSIDTFNPNIWKIKKNI